VVGRKTKKREKVMFVRDIKKEKESNGRSKMKDTKDD
jgi:hypothetical protein